MILATIGAREENTHVATAPSRSRRGEFSVCLLCWRGRGGLQYIGLSEDVEESDWSSAPVGYNVVYDVAVNL